MNSATIFKKLTSLEQQVQTLKVQAYLNLPKKQQTVALYPQKQIDSALKNTRNNIWREKYAKKISGIS